MVASLCLQGVAELLMSSKKTLVVALLGSEQFVPYISH